MRTALFLLFLTPVWLHAQPAKTSAPEKGRPELILDTGGQTGKTTQVLYTPDSKQLITISLDKTIRFWDIETGENLRVLRPPIGQGSDGELHAAALSDDGKILAVGGSGYAQGEGRRVPIYLIDLDKEKIVQVLEGHTGTIEQLSISADAKRHLSAAKDHTARLWDVTTGKTVRVIELEAKLKKQKKEVKLLPIQVAMAPDGLQAAVIAGDGVVQFLDATTGIQGKTLARLPGDKYGYSVVAWHPNSKMVAAGSYGPPNKGVEGWVRLLRPVGTVEKQFDLDRQVSTVSFSADGKILLATTRQAPGDWCQLVEIATGKKEGFRPASGRSSILEPGGKQIATVNPKIEAVELWSIDGGERVKKLAGLGDYRTKGSAALWTADGQEIRWPSGVVGLDLSDLRLISGSKKSREGLHGTVTKMEGHELNLTFPSKSAAALKISLPEKEKISAGQTFISGKRVAFTGASGRIFVFDFEAKLLRTLQGNNSPLNQTGLAPSPDGRYLLSVGTNGLAKIWALDQTHGQPLLSLYMARKDKGAPEWIVWTPEGYYATSSGGEKLMSWYVPGGPEQLATTVAAERFRKQFHRPDIISRLIELGSLEKAMAAADKERGIKTEQVPIEDAFPPSVMLEAPASAKDGTATVKVTAVSQGKFPVLELQLLVDGRPLATALQKFPKPTMGKVEAAWTIDIPPGQHQLNVVARTQVSTGLSSSHDITFADPTQTGPSLHVLSVGINSYPSDWKLTCAANDAKGIRQVFEQRSAATYRGVSSKLLIDAEATKSNILAELASLKKNVKPQDVAVIFFAGHGVKGKKGTFYLCPHGTDFADVEKTGISNDEIKKTLAQMQGRILVMLDACHSGASRLDEFARELTDDDCGVIVMCAATGRETAGEEKKLGHGYFAKAIIDGLGGKADVSKKDNQIYLHHLESYVIEAVQEWSGDEQHPVMSKPMSVRSFALAKAVK